MAQEYYRIICQVITISCSKTGVIEIVGLFSDGLAAEKSFYKTLLKSTQISVWSNVKVNQGTSLW